MPATLHPLFMKVCNTQGLHAIYLSEVTRGFRSKYTIDTVVGYAPTANSLVCMAYDDRLTKPYILCRITVDGLIALDTSCVPFF